MKHPSLPLVASLALCGALLPSTARSANYAWDGGTQTWTTLSSWDVGGSDPLTPPGSADSIISPITNNGNIQLNVNAQVTNWLHGAQTLTLVGNAGNHTLVSTGTVSVSGGELRFRNSGANQLSLDLAAVEVGAGGVQFGMWDNSSPLQSFQAASMNLTGGLTSFKLVNGGTASVSGTVAMANSATLSVRWTNTAGESGTLSVGALSSASPTAVVQVHHGATQSTGTLLLNNAASTSATFAGVVRNGGTGGNVLHLTKQGTGTQVLSGANTYSGTTHVSAGTLLVNGSHTGAGNYAVDGTGTLGGSGSVTTATGAGVTISSGGRLAPGGGEGLAGTLTMTLGTSTLNLSGAVGGANAGALIFDLGATSDQVLLASGTLDIGSGLLEFSDFTFTALSGFGAGSYTLFDTTTTIVGTLGANLSGTIGGLGATIAFSEDGRDLVLTVVPEPGSAALALLGGMVWLLRPRKRRSSDA